MTTTKKKPATYKPVGDNKNAKVVAGGIALLIVGVLAFFMLTASQQVELFVSVPHGVKAHVNGKLLLRCKHEVKVAGQKCDEKAAVTRNFRWFVNGGKTYVVTAKGPQGEAELSVPIDETPVSVRVRLESGVPVIDEPR